MYPDVFCFAFTNEQYQQHWAAIKSSNHYLVLNDMHLKPVGWKKHAWEQLKAGLGYTEDKVHSVRIQMAMQKLLYFGYLNGFNSNETVAFSPEFLTVYPLSEDFREACHQPRNNHRSLMLQQSLMAFYDNNSEMLRGWNHTMPHLVDEYFGKSYVTGDRSDDNLCTFAQLDPQQPPLGGCMELDLNRTLPNSTLRELLIGNKMNELQISLDDIILQTSTNKTYYYRENLTELKLKAERLLAFQPSLSHERSSFFVRLYVFLAERLALFDNEAEYYGKAFSIIKLMDNPTAIVHLNDCFLENDKAYSVIEKESMLLEAWLEHLYSDVVSNPEHQLCSIKGYRILTDKPMLIKAEHLTLFAQIASQYDAQEDAALTVGWALAQQHHTAPIVGPRPNLLDMDDSELTANRPAPFIEPLSFFARTTSAVFDFAKRLSPTMS